MNDHYMWLVKYLDINTRNNREFNKFTKDYAFFKVSIMTDLLHKFNKHSKYDQDFEKYDDDEHDQDVEKYDDDQYYDEAYRNYIQYKDLY